MHPPGLATRGRQRWSETQTPAPGAARQATAPPHPPSQQQAAVGQGAGRGSSALRLVMHEREHWKAAASASTGRQQPAPAPASRQPQAAVSTWSLMTVASLSRVGSTAAPAATVTSSGESWACPSSTQHCRTKSRAAGGQRQVQGQTGIGCLQGESGAAAELHLQCCWLLPSRTHPPRLPHRSSASMSA